MRVMRSSIDCYRYEIWLGTEEKKKRMIERVLSAFCKKKRSYDVFLWVSDRQCVFSIFLCSICGQFWDHKYIIFAWEVWLCDKAKMWWTLFITKNSYDELFDSLHIFPVMKIVVYMTFGVWCLMYMLWYMVCSICI